MMGYGTGAIMAVPAHDQRDYDFATKFNLPITQVVAPAKGTVDLDKPGHAFVEEGVAVNSEIINGMPTLQAKAEMITALEAEGTGLGSVKYKLRDWLFSRQRYWGEPFPIVLDAQGNARAISESELPLVLPELEDFKPTGTTEPPLSKAKDWLRWSDKAGQDFTRETNTMPQWAGSCWYYLRYIDPHNTTAFVDKAKEAYWMPVDLYVGGVEHAVLHLLYARFWHKVLFDLGHVSTSEPFKRLVNQGLILGEMEYHVFEKAGQAVSAAEVRDVDEEATEEGVKLFGYIKSSGEKVFGRRLLADDAQRQGEFYTLKTDSHIRIDARSFKMSKSRGNVVNPDKIVADYGADCLRLYEMYMGPLESQKPWNTRDIVGMQRFLSSVWRNLVGGDEESIGAPRVADVPVPDELNRQFHRATRKIGEDIGAMRFNTAIAEMIKLNNELTGMAAVPRELAEKLTLLLAPFAPHIAEELWNRLGHKASLAWQAWPTFDASFLTDTMMDVPVQVNGKLRDKITLPADATEETVLAAVLAAARVQQWIAGKTIRKTVYIPKKLVNIVV